jgi:hypothetical protein
MLVVELRSESARSPALRFLLSTGIVLLLGFLLLRTLSRYVELDPGVVAAVQSLARKDPESVWSSVLIHATGWGLAVGNPLLFLRRRVLV